MLNDASHRFWVTRSTSNMIVLFSIQDALYCLFFSVNALYRLWIPIGAPPVLWQCCVALAYLCSFFTLFSFLSHIYPFVCLINYHLF